MCAREVSCPAWAHVIVTTALNHVLERSEVARKQTGALMHNLVKEKVVTIEDFKKGVAAVQRAALKPTGQRAAGAKKARRKQRAKK